MQDLLILNGTVVDGSGEAPYIADIAVTGGKITKIGQLKEEKAKKIIKAQGLIVCPGFIDDHSHGDLNALLDPHAANQLLQGITTEVGGQCGVSLAPIREKPYSMAVSLIPFRNNEERERRLKPMTFPEWMDQVEKTPLGINLVCLIGQGTVRAAVMGYASGEADDAQMEEMRTIVREAMKAGAAGISTGLIYPTGTLTDTPELTELAKVVGEYNGLYCTHMRDESDEILTGIKEALQIASGAGTRLVISHHKIIGLRNAGKSRETLAMVDAANAAGMDVYMDQYPYDAGATALMAALPERHAADKDALLKNLPDPEYRALVKSEMEAGIGGGMAKAFDGLSHVFIGWTDLYPDYAGRSPVEIAAETRKDPYEILFDVLLDTKAEVRGIFQGVAEEDLQRIMQHERTMFGTDASHATFVNGFGHPRAFGTFPLVLTKYVRDEKILSIEEMVRKASALPAQVLGLEKKGILKPGNDADIVVMDLEGMKVSSSYTNPDGGNKGFRYVLVNGEIAVENDQCTDRLGGRLLRISHDR